MENKLSNMKVGHTKLINGHVVTRWSDRAFEVDTWGKVSTHIYEAIELVRK